jgi:t-SNARE complex subunit (syntaxin)
MSKPVKNQEEDKLSKIQDEINRTKDVMKDNINKTIARGEKLEQIEDKAENLNNRAKTFQSTAKAARRQMCWQNWRNILLIVLVVTIISVILYFIFRPSS